MKKTTAVLLAAVMALSLAACSAAGAKETTAETPSAAVSEAQEQTEVPETEIPETEPAETAASETEASETEMPETEVSETENAEAESTGILVAYFSCTGNTEAVAQQAAELLGADLYEITPEVPYTEEDLNYNDSSTRATTEQDDPDARPAISGSVANMEQYETILLGYPIWWGQAPRIISTFLESYDFSGKTIVPFCTSGSSGVGSSADNLHALCSDDAVWMDGTRFDGAQTTAEEISQWLSEMGVG